MLLVIVLVLLSLFILYMYVSAPQTQVGGGVVEDVVDTYMSRPDVQAIKTKVTPHLVKAFQNSREDLGNAYNASKFNLEKAQLHLRLAEPEVTGAYNKILEHIKQVQPDVTKAYTKLQKQLMDAQPELIQAYQKSMPHLKKAYDKARPHLIEATVQAQPHVANEIGNLGKTINALSRIIRNYKVVKKQSDKLDEINTKLDRTDKLNKNDHMEIREIAIKTKDVKNQIDAVENQLNQIKLKEGFTSSTETVNPWILKRLQEREQQDEDAREIQLSTQEQKEITQAPTTQAPTTQTPTTQAPTTQAPTTQAPTTQAPTTQAPTTQAPKATDKALQNHCDMINQRIDEIKSITMKNYNVLADIKNKLETTQGKSNAAGPAVINESTNDKKLVEQTTKTIKENCPVCPMFTSTNPVNVLEVTNQGFGTIAPPTLGPNYT